MDKVLGLAAVVAILLFFGKILIEAAIIIGETPPLGWGWFVIIIAVLYLTRNSTILKK